MLIDCSIHAAKPAEKPGGAEQAVSRGSDRARPESGASKWHMRLRKQLRAAPSEEPAASDEGVGTMRSSLRAASPTRRATGSCRWKVLGGSFDTLLARLRLLAHEPAGGLRLRQRVLRRGAHGQHRHWRVPH